MLILPITEISTAPVRYGDGVLAGQRCGNCAHFDRLLDNRKLGYCDAMPQSAQKRRFDDACCVRGGAGFRFKA